MRAGLLNMISACDSLSLLVVGARDRAIGVARLGHAAAEIVCSAGAARNAGIRSRSEVAGV